jgi:transcription elongation factor GreA
MRLSQRTLERLEAELIQIEQVLLPAARAAVEDSRTQGDSSQNPDYFVAAEAEASLLTRQSSIRHALDAHAGSSAAPAAEGVASPGRFLLLDFGAGPEEFLLGSIEERWGDVEVVTPTSPIGAAVTGLRKGARFRLPSGVEVVLVDVRAA